MIQAAIFDMDGVIIDSEPIHDHVWKKFFEEQGVPVDAKDLDSMRGIPPLATIQKFMPYSTDEQELQKLHDRRAEILTEEFENGSVPLVVGVKEFMEKLRNEKIHIAVATSTKRTIAIQILQKVEVYEFIDFIVGGDEITKGKPDPEIFLTTAKKFGLAPEDCVVFEDSQAGVEAGLRAGMDVVAILTTHKKDEFPKVQTFLYDFAESNAEKLLEEVFKKI